MRMIRTFVRTGRPRLMISDSEVIDLLVRTFDAVLVEGAGRGRAGY
jgi:hypothetical protein